MKLEICIEADNLLQHELLAELAQIVPEHHIGVTGVNPESKRFMLTISVEENSPDLLLQKIGMVVSRFEKYRPGGEDIYVRVMDAASAEPPVNTAQISTPFSPVEGIRIIFRNGTNGSAPGRRDILMEPSQAFGSGLHPSTRLCLHFLKRLADENPEEKLTSHSVIDIGCGSGILTIGALRLGADMALGIEIDPEAVQAARRNLQINQLTHAARILATSWHRISGEYDLVLANLVPSVLFKGAPGIAKLLKPRGFLITSGFPAASTMKVAEIFAGHDLRLTDELSADGWGALLLTR